MGKHEIWEMEIVSGEGTVGTMALYTGKRTARAVRSRLTRERCRGDRWAFVTVNGQRVDDNDLESILSV